MPEIDKNFTNIRLKFAHVMKTEREKMGLGVKEFGQMMGFKDHHMQIKYEKAQVKVIPIDTFVKFSEIVRIPYQDIIATCYFDLNFTSENTAKKREEFFSMVDKKYFENIIEPNETIGTTIKKSNELIKMAHFISKLPEDKKLNLFEDVLNETYKLETTTEEEKLEIKKDLQAIYEDMLKLIENKLKATELALST
ncbi:MAG: hypothetical protein K2X69_09090 [Silvanigrellaceae bacterium]|nr:hypothetical protein [Silvanigrellaceae bacterium]